MRLGHISLSPLESMSISKGWTLKEEMVHIVQVLELMLDGIERAIKGGRRSTLAIIPPGIRSWVNGQIIIPLKAKNETRATIAAAYQDAHKILVNLLVKLKDADWKKGMPYPRKFRTVEQMAYHQVEHFEEHEVHIRRCLKVGSNK